MQDTTYILKEPELEQSQDYALLKEVGIQHIESLARKLWTDYNVHDPGITLLELLCYGITDLGHRTAYDIRDILTEQINGVAQNNGNFHTARHIFPCNPVSFNDLRKLLIDIDGVHNAWIGKNKSVIYQLDPLTKTLKDTPTLPTDEALEPLNGLYNVLLQYEDFIADERIIRLGEIDTDTAAAVAPDGFQLPDEEGMEFFVQYDTVLEAVHLYAAGAAIGDPDNLTIRLWRKEADGTFAEVIFPEGPLTSTLTNPDTAQKVRVPLSIPLESGYTYRLDAKGTTAELFKKAGNYSYFISPIIALMNGYDGTTTDNDYYYFFDWELSYAVNPAIQLPTETINGEVGLADNTDPATGNFMNASGQGLFFHVYHPLTLNAVTIYPNSSGTLNIRLWDRTDTELESLALVVAPGTTELEVALGWAIEPGSDYRLTANGASFELYRTTNPGFPFQETDIIEITAGRTLGGNPTPNNYYFLYHWQIEYQTPVVQVSEITKSDIRLEVLERLHTVRNLCEDFIHIRGLEQEEIGLCADIEVRPDVNVEEVMAEILYQLELYVSPAVQFYTIEELVAKGKTMDEIFEGPLLDHGFIDDDEFRALERRCFLRTSDVIQLIMDINGVLAVKNISLLSFIAILASEKQPGDTIIVEEGQIYRVQEEPWILALQDLSKYAPDFSPQRSRIIFYKKGLPYYASMERVMELFEEKRARNISNKLKGHEQDLPVPVGQYKALHEYFPVQNDLPETYRTGRFQVEKSASDLRKAQSKQLRGFLMFFEQTFTNYLAQLSHVKELFSWESTTPIQSYFTQEIEGLYQQSGLYQDYPNLLPDLQEIIETKAVAEERKNRFLDHLLGRFAEDFTEYGLLMYHMFEEEGPAKVAADKQAFLADYPKVSSLRGKAFDYRFPFDPANLSGYQCRLYRLLGIDQVERRNFASPYLKVVQVEAADSIGCTEDHWRFVYETAEGERLFLSYCCEKRAQICAYLDEIIGIAAAPGLDLEGDLTAQVNTGAFRYIKNAGTGWDLVTRCPGETPDDPEIVTLLGHIPFDGEAILKQVIEHFRAYAGVEGFHVIEHILLRKRTLDDPFMPVEVHSVDEECECVEVKDPYSFRASIILPSWPGRFQNIRFRQYVEELLRLEAPAHVLLKICWISHCEMQSFETCHDDWLEKHAALDSEYHGGFEIIDETPPARLPAIAELPSIDVPEMEAYRDALASLIRKLHGLTTVFPSARLHDCQEVSGDMPQITLNNTSLGTL